ncbi:MAG TPA: sugar porter family MFS transporter [Candidatus Sulfotelmatobacter sp.]|nr:sugar porter family MFS transporter [Candidatus Sulfotelmatobacter sp.]
MPDSELAARPHVNHSFLARISFIAALGGVLYGYDMGIIAAALIFVQHTFQLPTIVEEWVVSIVLVGAMLGAMVGGAVADRIGRRATLVWAGAIFIAGSVLAPLSPNVATLIVARAIIGIGIGFTSVTAPVYVSELAPPQSRGMLIGLYQFALTLGIAGADLVGYWLAPQEGWRLMFAIAAVPTLFFLGVILTVPESPRWLFAHGREKDAESVLLSYTDTCGAKQFLADIREGLKTPMEQSWAALLTPAVRGSVLIAVGMTVLQQVTGINTIIYYGPQIFEFAGISSHSHSILATLLVAVVNVIFTVVGIMLVDRVGRKPLLYAGVGGMTVALFALAYSFSHQASLGTTLGYIAIGCLILYIACFAFSLGAIAWILVSEVFPLRVRGRGVAVATLFSGISNFAVSLTFLSLIKAVGSASTFAIYGALSIVTLLFVRFVVPETCGRELESISAHKENWMAPPA